MRNRPLKGGTALISYSTEQFGLALGQPFACRGSLALRAMPVAAAVERDDRMRAALTPRDMAAERRGAAALDRRHRL
jgi:hypothetical protein